MNINTKKPVKKLKSNNKKTLNKHIKDYSKYQRKDKIKNRLK